MIEIRCGATETPLGENSKVPQFNMAQICSPDWRNMELKR